MIVEGYFVLILVTLCTLRVFVDQENFIMQVLIQCGNHRVELQVLLLEFIDVRSEPVQEIRLMLCLNL